MDRMAGIDFPRFYALFYCWYHFISILFLEIIIYLILKGKEVLVIDKGRRQV